MKNIKYSHLTLEDHKEVERLVDIIHRAFYAMSHRVDRASFTDEVLRTQKIIQTKLIQPLISAWEAEDLKDWNQDPYTRRGFHGGSGTTAPSRPKTFFTKRKRFG